MKRILCRCLEMNWSRGQGVMGGNKTRREKGRVWTRRELALALPKRACGGFIHL